VPFRHISLNYNTPPMESGIFGGSMERSGSPTHTASPNLKRRGDDLPRQRRARREFGRDPEEARVRDEKTV